MSLVITALFLATLFAATYALARRIDNLSIVDVTWSLAFAPVAVFYAAVGDGWLPRRVVAASLVALWSLRLGTYLWTRVAAHHPAEDPRYAVLRERWGTGAKVFLPFEGDRTLSIILSKAFLLAEDTTITDKTIISQIKR